MYKRRKAGRSARPTRERDAERTRAAILAAARKLFATRGFAHTGVRDVAQLAKVNSALVARYFGSKDGLYRATLQRYVDMAPLLEADRQSFGKNFTSAVFDTPDASTPLAMMILSAGASSTRRISVQFLETVLKPLASWLGPPNGRERALRIAILWTGFLTSEKLLPLDRGMSPATRRWLEETTQAIVDARS